MKTSDMARTCCFTGPRPKNYPAGDGAVLEVFLLNELRRAVREAAKKGYRHFISGMAAGVDLLAARAVSELREECPALSVTLEAAVPFPSQPARWTKDRKSEYHAILARCDCVHLVSDHFSISAYRRRDRYMVEHSSLVIGVEGKPNGGTAKTLALAKELGRKIVLIGPGRNMT